MPPRRKDLQQKVLEWGLFTLLGLAVKFLAGIQTEIKEVSRTLTIAVTKVEDHERRLENIETLFLRKASDP